jgi:exopolyphosphatase / guanosine-5'-triphosphate,3'-diphosphate pyrophosphatase
VTVAAPPLRPAWAPESAPVQVGVIDAGANTLRLLVVRQKRGSVAVVCEERVRLGLGEEIERLGRISETKLAELAVAAAAQAERARTLGCERLEVLVTSPGRQSANPNELGEALERATGAPVRLLSGEDEAVLGYAGAVGACRRLPKSVAVCDVGGGSTQVTVGTPEGGAAWARSFDIGSLRLARRSLPGDPPSEDAIEAAQGEAARCLDGLLPPRAKAALAVGGSARAAAKLVGERLGRRELDRAVELLSTRSHSDVSQRFRIAPQRAETLLAGVLILAEVQRRLGLVLQLGAGGVREGAVRELLQARVAA